MNKTFDWTRFCNVVRKDTNNIWQHFGLTMLIIALLPLCVWLLWWAFNGVEYAGGVVPEIRWAMIACCVCLASIMAPSRMYRTCNLQKEGIYYAMLPASKLEKYLSMMFICVIVCPLLVLCGGVVLDVVLTALPFGPYDKWLWQTGYIGEFYRGVYEGLTQQSDAALAAWGVLQPWRLILYIVLSYLGSCATYMFTATIFKKHKVLQTILWLWLISFALNIVTMPIMGYAMLDGEWLEKMFEGIDPVRTVNVWYWILMAWQTVYAGVLFWWAGYRLKKMKY